MKRFNYAGIAFEKSKFHVCAGQAVQLEARGISIRSEASSTVQATGSLDTPLSRTRGLRPLRERYVCANVWFLYCYILVALQMRMSRIASVRRERWDIARYGRLLGGPSALAKPSTLLYNPSDRQRGCGYFDQNPISLGPISKVCGVDEPIYIEVNPSRNPQPLTQATLRASRFPCWWWG